MTDLAPLQHFAIKLAAAFEDLEIELGPRAGLKAPPRAGRPRAQFAYGKVLILREAGLSWGDIARELGAARTTVRKVYADLRRTSS